ncbi:hypothetical protein BGX30_003203 [Mortierella sp. GBA39]|nr:hypothetical protein BGX30_003203 [Mortierella sp. GBA39]
MTSLIAFAQTELSENYAQLHDLEDAYVALPCIVSAAVNDASNVFGSGLTTQIESQVTPKELALSILTKVLSPLQENVAKNNYGLNFLRQEVELRLAELVLCERDGSWTINEETVDLTVSRQVYQVLHFFCVVIVAHWSHVWRILFTKTCIVVNNGELASVATKEDILGWAILECAKEISGGEVHFVECSVNGHKPLHVRQAALREQSREVMRINRSILSCSGSQNTVLFIDAHNLCGKIYGMRAIEDIYGVSSTLGKPGNYEDQDGQDEGQEETGWESEVESQDDQGLDDIPDDGGGERLTQKTTPTQETLEEIYSGLPVDLVNSFLASMRSNAYQVSSEKGKEKVTFSVITSDRSAPRLAVALGPGYTFEKVDLSHAHQTPPLDKDLSAYDDLTAADHLQETTTTPL